MYKIYNVFKQINCLVWPLIISYILALVSMDVIFTRFSSEGITLTLPLITVLVVVTHYSMQIIRVKENHISTNKSQFLRDFFCIFYSFLLAGFWSLLFQYDNSDAKAWWPLFLYLNCGYGIIFSLFYALISHLFGSHKLHTIAFALITFFLFTFSKYWSNRIGNHAIDGYFVGMLSLIILNLFLCIIFKFNSSK